MTLTSIGNDMRARLANVEKGYVSQALFGGLIVVLERRGTTWRLAIGRTSVAPSKTEAKTIARDFGLSEGLEWSWATRRNRKQRVTYQVAQCTWIERIEEGGG